nr:MAG: ERF superfamily protein [Bacteriophage sp.]
MNYRKILNIQSSLKSKKDSYNQFGKYSFRSAEQIYENLKPLLIENNLLLTFQEEIIGGNIMECTAQIIDLDDNSSERYSTQIFLDEDLKGMSKGQASGCTISYVRKYLLCGIFLIDNGEDLDNINNNSNQKPQQKENKDEMKEAFIKNIFNAKNKSELSQLWKNNIYGDDNRVVGAFKARKSQLGLDRK